MDPGREHDAPARNGELAERHGTRRGRHDPHRAPRRVRDRRSRRGRDRPHRPPTLPTGLARRVRAVRDRTGRRRALRSTRRRRDPGRHAVRARPRAAQWHQARQRTPAARARSRDASGRARATASPAPAPRRPAPGRTPGVRGVAAALGLDAPVRDTRARAGALQHRRGESPGHRSDPRTHSRGPRLGLEPPRRDGRGGRRRRVPQGRLRLTVARPRWTAARRRPSPDVGEDAEERVARAVPRCRVPRRAVRVPLPRSARDPEQHARRVALGQVRHVLGPSRVGR